MFREHNPEREEVELRVGGESGTVVRDWTQYTFNSNFLTPTDGFSFTIGEEALAPGAFDSLIPGAKVTLHIAGKQQATGFIDSIERSAGRGDGIEWSIEGRDILSVACDSGIDPKTQFKPGMRLIELIIKAFEPFGLANNVVDYNDDNLSVMTGQTRGNRTTNRGKTAKNAGIGQLRPHDNEGCFAFVSRISQRKGLWIWPSADGASLIVGKPDFTTPQVITWSLRRKFNGKNNNVLSGSAKIDITDQPTVVVVEGFSGGGEFGKSKIKAVYHNPFVRVRGKTQAETIATIVAKWKGAKVIAPDFTVQESSIIETASPRVVYLRDEESHNDEELESYARREMSLHTRKLVSAHYTMLGHLAEGEDGQLSPWAVDTAVFVDDEVTGIREFMWVLGRTFEKSRSGGTTTKLDLIKLNTLVF